MDKTLLIKYFRNQCSLEEIEQVVDWFQTEEGEAFLENRLDKDLERYSKDENLLLSPEISSVKMLEGIETARSRSEMKTGHRRVKDHWWLRVAAVLLLSGLFSVAVYWGWMKSESASVAEHPVTEEPSYHRIYTDKDQQRRITLGDGTQVRLNSSSILEIPDTYPTAGRHVRLRGEGYFQVVHNENNAFTVQVEGAVVKVLGTEFNVKEDSLLQQVQVAVADGKVSLSNRHDESGREVLLIKDTFATLDVVNGRVVMENVAVDNYLSWMTGRLQFYDEPLKSVSQHLSRIYGVTFEWESDQLESMRLSAEIMKKDINSVLDVISKTLGIGYHVENEVVTWVL